MINVNVKDPYIVLTGDRKDMIKLEKHFNIIPKYQLLPTYPGIPRPEVFLFKTIHNNQDVYWMSRGLSQELMYVCKKNNIVLNGLEGTFVGCPHTLEEFSTICKTWTTLEPRDYQIEAAWNIINRTWSTSELATRAGKTLICSLVLRYMMEYKGIKKVLYIVPSIHLVKQGVKDLRDYMDFFGLGEVWAGSDVCGDENCIIGTLQSIVLRLDPQSKHYNPSFFDGIDLVLVDEAHKAKCKSINIILQNLKGVQMRFGVTGTVPKDKIDRYKVLSLLGPVIQTIGAHELIEEGFLAEAHIEQIHIHHKFDNCIGECEGLLFKDDIPLTIQKLKERISPMEYQEYLIKSLGERCKIHVLENNLLQQDPKRLELINSLIDRNENTIIFIHNVAYGKAIKEYLENQGHKVMIINGSIPLKRRQKIIETLKESGHVLVGSFGCVGTGLTFNNVHTGIFAQSFKSDIITKQSLGRLMLRNSDKEVFKLYDLVDVFPTCKLKNHGDERLKIYKHEKLI